MVFCHCRCCYCFPDCIVLMGLSLSTKVNRERPADLTCRSVLVDGDVDVDGCVNDGSWLAAAVEGCLVAAGDSVVVVAVGCCSVVASSCSAVSVECYWP